MVNNASRRAHRGSNNAGVRFHVFSTNSMKLGGGLRLHLAALLASTIRAQCVGSGNLRLESNTGHVPDLVPSSVSTAATDVDCFRQCLRVEACVSGFWKSRASPNCFFFDTIIPSQSQRTELGSLYFVRTGRWRRLLEAVYRVSSM